MVSHIWEMAELHYFVEGGAHASGEETVLELEDNEVIISEEFFSAALRMPPHIRHFPEVSGAATPTHPQCDRAAVEAP
jgi:hypothetical protein